MKPDWQNKSFAKSGSPAGPSTTHPKLKIGMSSLHSKIAVANHNTVQAKKPAVRKMADGGSVRTRSDDQIWWESQPGNRGKDYPGDEIASKQYERNKAAGEENLSRLKSAAESIRSFFSREKPVDLSQDTSATETESPRKNVGRFGEAMNDATTESSTSKSETASNQAPAVEPDYMKDVRETITKPKASPVAPPSVVEEKPLSSPSASQSSAAANNSAPSAPSVSSVTSQPKAKAPKTINRSNQSGKSQKDIERLILEKKAQAGNEAMKRAEEDRTSTTDTGDEVKRLKARTSKFLPGVGQVDLQGNIITGQRGGLQPSQVYGGDGSTFMSRAEKKYLQSRIDAGNLTPMEKAQAKRAGLL